MKKSRMEPKLSLTCLQAKAMAKLIRIQLRAYRDAESDAPDGPEPEPELFTGDDLDTIAPLLEALPFV